MEELRAEIEAALQSCLEGRDKETFVTKVEPGVYRINIKNHYTGKDNIYIIKAKSGRNGGIVDNIE